MNKNTKKQILGVFIISVALTFSLSNIFAQQDKLWTRNMTDFNWMEFREIVPEKVNTVLIAIGTVEPHGVSNNGTDNLIPEALAKDIAPEVNALVAPTISYGLTRSLDNYPGSFGVSTEAFRAYVFDVIKGLQKIKFKNIIVLNGHGPNRSILNEVCERITRSTGVRTLVVDWWSYCSDVTLEVFGEDGGHAGLNENSMVLAINPELVKKERYSKNLTTILDNTYSAFPSPAPIILYKKGEGYLKFNKKKAEEYYNKVKEKITQLIKNTINKWDLMGL
ncbi:creatininase family protein [candidate division KSB1 bacterium]|nr:MAG: creatininase family protein [candidate division KSB1 bacterium]